MREFHALVKADNKLAVAVAQSVRESGLSVVPAALQAIVVELAATRAALDKVKSDIFDMEIDIYG